jgi:hypothetical protein
VLATAVLAWFTRELAQQARLAWMEARSTRHEMERSRELSVRPVIAFDVHVAGGKVGFLLLRNLGGGPAFAVTLQLKFGGEDVREWSERSIEPGESHQFKLPAPFQSDIWRAQDVQFTVDVSGQMTDVEGRTIEVSAAIDFTEWTRSAENARERIVGRRKIAGVEPA